MSLDYSSVAVAVSTYYPKWYSGKLRSIAHTDKIRGDLALELISATIARGCHIVVVDCGSTKTYRKMLVAIQGATVVLARTLKRSPARREAIRRASRIPGVQTIIVTEPEKTSLITKCLDELITPFQDGKTAMVIPSRDLRLFKSSYPAYQVGSEIEGNELFNEQLQLAGFLSKQDYLDVFFGPRAFRNTPDVIRLFMRKFTFRITSQHFPHQIFDPEELSNTLFFPIVFALKKKLRVRSVEVPFTYPLLQKQNEEHGPKELFIEKRRSQRLGTIVDLMYLLQIL